MRLLVFPLFFFASFVFAQDDKEVFIPVPEDTVPSNRFYVQDSIRAKFIRNYPNHFFIWPVIKRRSLQVDVQSLVDAQRRVRFTPNNSVSMGLGFYVFEIAFELAFAVPIDERSVSRYGKTDSRDFQLNAIGKFWGFDIYSQKYSGFYLDDSFVPIRGTTPYPQRADLDTRNFGMAGIYTFNRDKFSFRSSYTFAEQQLYSRGSFFISGTLNSFKMNADSVILSISNRDQFSEFADFTQFGYTTLGIAPGYSHNFIYKNFFLNLTLGLGPAHNWTRLITESGNEEYNVSINSISVFRMGIGYNSDHFFAGLGFVNQSRNVKLDDMRITNSTSFLKLLIGFRFKERGILKKRAVDLIPFKIG